MAWFKVDDSLAFHSKTLEAGNDAMGLWVRAGAWCSQQLTDGRIPKHVVAMLGTRRQADRLVTAGLWTRDGDAFAFHEWSERQPSRDEVETKRRAARNRMAQVRASRAQGVRANDERTTDERSRGGSRSVRLTPTRPDPTRPDPSLLPTEEEPPLTSSGAPRKRGTRIPVEFPVTPAMAEWATENAPNAGARDHEQFRDYWAAKTGQSATKLDWVATWRTWMRKASDDRVRPGRPGTAKPTPTERAADVAAAAARVAARLEGHDPEANTPHLRAIGG